MTIYNEVKTLADTFHARFHQDDVMARVGYDLVAAIHDYVDHNECSLAFEILCEQLYEYNITITREELSRITEVGTKLCLENSFDWEFLEELVQQ